MSRPDPTAYNQKISFKTKMGESSESVPGIVAVSSDGKTIARNFHSVDQRRLKGIEYKVDKYSVLLIDAETGKKKRGFKEQDRITSIAFSPDGKRLATGGLDNIVKLQGFNTNSADLILNPYIIFFTPIPVFPLPCTVDFSILQSIQSSTHQSSDDR